MGWDLVKQKDKFTFTLRTHWCPILTQFRVTGVQTVSIHHITPINTLGRSWELSNRTNWLRPTSVGKSHHLTSGYRVISPGIKWPERQADHSPASSVELYLHPRIQLHITVVKDRDNLLMTWKAECVQVDTKHCKVFPQSSPSKRIMGISVSLHVSSPKLLKDYQWNLVLGSTLKVVGRLILVRIGAM